MIASVLTLWAPPQPVPFLPPQGKPLVRVLCLSSPTLFLKNNFLIFLLMSEHHTVMVYLASSFLRPQAGWDWLPSPDLIWLCNIPFCDYTSLFIHSPAEGHLGCFWFSAAMNCGAVNILQGDFRSPCSSISLRCTPGSGAAGQAVGTGALNYKCDQYQLVKSTSNLKMSVPLPFPRFLLLEEAQ